MTVLVTGGAGYIGSHMALRLGDAGEPTVVLDNLTTGFDWAVDHRATLVQGDAGLAPSDLRQLVSLLVRKHDFASGKPLLCNQEEAELWSARFPQVRGNEFPIVLPVLCQQDASLERNLLVGWPFADDGQLIGGHIFDELDAFVRRELTGGESKARLSQLSIGFLDIEQRTSRSVAATIV